MSCTDEDDSLEEALYSGLRALEESAALSRRMARRAVERTNAAAARSLEEKANAPDKNAETLRQALLGGAPRAERTLRRAKHPR